MCSRMFLSHPPCIPPVARDCFHHVIKLECQDIIVPIVELHEPGLLLSIWGGGGGGYIVLTLRCSFYLVFSNVFYINSYFCFHWCCISVSPLGTGCSDEESTATVPCCEDLLLCTLLLPLSANPSPLLIGCNLLSPSNQGSNGELRCCAERWANSSN